ncbi:methylmalonate-semialdehyde dehydrogenase (CoA acylating), partial [Marinococcus halophilus]
MKEQAVTTLKNFIGGEWVTSRSATDQVYNPATSEVIARVPLSSKDEVNEAVEASKAAYRDWSTKPVPQRARILFAYQQLLVSHWDEL